MKHVSLTKLDIANTAGLSEQWVQTVLTEEPSLLGFGELDVRETERRQRAGRLDMLLYDPDSNTRYEVELQVGATDASHIIRTLEYWENERRRYPQYEHVAVIVAEEITSRFFNVISLFNGFIPIVAIQMTALRVDDDVAALVFTRVLDHESLGTDQEDEPEAADRAYWDKHSTPLTMGLVDRLVEVAQHHEPGTELNYNKYYIGLLRAGVPTAHVSFIPRKQWVIVRFRIPRSDNISDRVQGSGVRTQPYRYGRYRVIFGNAADVDKHEPLFVFLFEEALKER